MLKKASASGKVSEIICTVLFCFLMAILMPGPSMDSSRQWLWGRTGGHALAENIPNEIDDAYICTVLDDAGGCPDLIRITGFAEISSNSEPIDRLKEMALSAADYFKNALNADTIGLAGPVDFNLTAACEKDVKQVKASFAADNISGSIIFQSREIDPLSKINPDNAYNNVFSGMETDGEYTCDKKPSDKTDKEFLTVASAEINVYFCDSDSLIDVKDTAELTEKIICQSADKSEKIKDGLYEYFNHNYNGINISTTYRGVLSKRINCREMSDASDIVFGRLGGNAVDDTAGNNFISRWGYSPLVCMRQANLHSIKGGPGKENSCMNINVALKYNGYEDKSYIWIGIPVICAEY